MRARSSSVISIISPARPHYRLEYLHIPRAAAEIPRQAVTNLVFSWVRGALKQIHCGENHSRRADAALRAAAFDERLLHSVQLIAGRDAFDGFDRSACDLRHRHQTTVDDPAIDHDA